MQISNGRSFFSHTFDASVFLLKILLRRMVGSWLGHWLAWFLGRMDDGMMTGLESAMARCLWTFKSALAKWTHISGLRVLLTSMIESIKVMLWMVLLVLAFVYVYSLVLTESIWDTCTDDEMSLVCARFGNVLSSMMTLYQIMYSGLLWGDLWNEVRFMAWYIQGRFLVIHWICPHGFGEHCHKLHLQPTEHRQQEGREVLIDNEMDYNERLVRQLYVIFKDFDQNGNGAISWAEFQLALEDEKDACISTCLGTWYVWCGEGFPDFSLRKDRCNRRIRFLVGLLALAWRSHSCRHGEDANGTGMDAWCTFAVERLDAENTARPVNCATDRRTKNRIYTKITKNQKGNQEHWDSHQGNQERRPKQSYQRRWIWLFGWTDSCLSANRVESIWTSCNSGTAGTSSIRTWNVVVEDGLMQWQVKQFQ